MSAFSLSFMMSVAGSALAAKKLAEKQDLEVAKLIADTTALATKVDTLLRMTADGFWTKYLFATGVYLIVMFFVSLFFAFWIETLASSRRSSYLLFTQRAVDLQRQELPVYERSWYKLIAWLLSNLAMGLAVNHIYAKVWQ